MKLYKLFEEVIFEATGKFLISENVSDDQVIDAINGKYNVNITYDDYPDAESAVAPSRRYIQVYNFAETKAGNKAIRAFQIFGGSKTTPKKGAWKIFRLDRIRSWQPTNMKWKNPISDKDPSIPKYNNNGDRTMSRVMNKVNLGASPQPPISKGKPEVKPTVSQPNKPIVKPQAKQSVKPKVKPQAKSQQSSYISNYNPKPVDTSSTTGPNKKQQNNVKPSNTTTSRPKQA